LRRAYDVDASQRNAFVDLEWRAPLLERWLQQLPSSPRLLELGPGTGQLAAHAESLGARVHAIDLSARNVACCRERGISAEVGDFRELARRAGLGLFDGIYAINALLHVPRAEHASVVGGARRCLVPGGGLLLVNWGGRDAEGVFDGDNLDPPRFFSQHADLSFNALTFEGFQVVRREILPFHTSDGTLRPQVLILRSLP
jgi:SAM-dependent methyltransferase